MAQRKGSNVRDRKLTNGLAKKLHEIERALRTFQDDELEGCAKHLRSANEGNCWYLIHQHRDTLLHLIREEQAERRRQRSHVSDSLDLS